NGHATVCLRSDAAPRGQWGALRIVERSLDRYRGKRVRMSAMIRSEGVNFRGGLFLNAMDGSTVLASSPPKWPVTATVGWLKYSADIDVPANAQSMESGVVLNGRGKVWVDDVK